MALVPATGLTRIPLVAPSFLLEGISVCVTHRSNSHTWVSADAGPSLIPSALRAGHLPGITAALAVRGIAIHILQPRAQQGCPSFQAPPHGWYAVESGLEPGCGGSQSLNSRACAVAVGVGGGGVSFLPLPCVFSARMCAASWGAVPRDPDARSSLRKKLGPFPQPGAQGHFCLHEPFKKLKSMSYRWISLFSPSCLGKKLKHFCRPP